jgi:ubiquinone/menaquinone biosynthesis C-methylase UbiE
MTKRTISKTLFKQFLQLPADALIASSKKLRNKISESVMRDPHLSEKFFPYKADQTSYIILKSSEQGRKQGDLGLPVPPENLWEGYGTSTEDFLNSGKVHVDKMKKILESSFFRIREGNRVLELGCASGRMIRWLDDFAKQCEIWGVDISANHIIWCQQHLSPPFNFATVTTAPHLPFEDGYFDLIYCGSVFTHIADLADAWLLELKRIVRRGGRLYITIHDRHTADLIINHPEKVYDTGGLVDDEPRNLLLSYQRKEDFSSLDFNMFTISRGPMSQVYYDIDYLRQHWGRFLNVLSVTPEAYGYQTAIVLEK